MSPLGWLRIRGILTRYAGPTQSVSESVSKNTCGHGDGDSNGGYAKEGGHIEVLKTKKRFSIGNSGE